MVVVDTAVVADTTANTEEVTTADTTVDTAADTMVVITVDTMDRTTDITITTMDRTMDITTEATEIMATNTGTDQHLSYRLQFLVS